MHNEPQAAIFVPRGVRSIGAAGLAGAGRILPGSRGSALVVVLALLVLLAGIVLAFFSRAVDQRRVSAVSAAHTEAGLFADAAAEMIVGDFRQEIAAGSLADTLADNNPAILNRITAPEVVTIAGQSVAPGMRPQRVASDGINVLKKSRDGGAFYTADAWYAAATAPVPTPGDGPVRASAVATSTPSLKGRAISLERWKIPRLLTPAEEATFSAPDWIYVDRNGSNPTDLSPAALPALADSATGNASHVIGRYAYVVYDVGGLVDINVVGNALSTEENARRGGLHQVSLASGLAGIPFPDFADFVAWRSAVSQANADTTPGGGGLFDPQRSFLKVEAGDQGFLNRQDLIKYAERVGSPLPTALLPYLSTFTRDLDAPVLRPDPLRSKFPASPDPEMMNPDALGIRFSSETVLSRGGVDPVSVPAGTSVMPRKFPLPKIELLSEAAPDPDLLSYFFGLQKRTDGVFEYIASGAGGSILTLAEVADQGREPNFFEVLQASILTGSLAKSGPNTYNYEESSAGGPGPDTLHRLQIFRIGANIIDQWDADNAPTRIESPSGVAGDPLAVFGIENLPYVSQVSVVGYRPEGEEDTFQAWAAFDVWNPHQNAGTPPSDVTGFRIIPVGGAGNVALYYNPAFVGLPGPNLLSTSGPIGFLPTRSLLSVNSGRSDLEFSAAGDYSEPTTVGVAPDSAGGVPGILLNEETVGVSIPPRGLRSSAVQQALNEQVRRVAPLSPTPPIIPGSGPNGEYVYPAGTTFTTLDPTAWEQVDTGSEILVSANYGVKAHNYMRLWPNTADPYVFDVQAEIDGAWVTIQRLEGWFRASDGPQNPPDNTLATMLEHTHHLEPTRNVLRGFYTWMARGGSCGMIRADPRCTRLGSCGVSAWTNFPSNTSLNNFTGQSVRSSTAPVTTPVDATVRFSENWLAGTGNHSSGYGGTGFEFADATKYLGLYPVSFTFGYAANSPDALNAAHPMRYADPDGVIRPGDAFFGGYPLVAGHLAERPLVLNRPFRSVAELGYAFRDLPWKTLDFSTRFSGDLGLLGAFSLTDLDANPPLRAGRLNLNTPHPEILAAVMEGAARQLPGVAPSLSSSTMDGTLADAVAADIVAENQSRPFLSAGDLVTRVLDPSGGGSALSDEEKVRREASIRSLAEVGSTRTWNLLIDIIAQTGRFTERSRDAGDFMVQGETHLWLHVAIDRFTGQVLDRQLEVVDD